MLQVPVRWSPVRPEQTSTIWNWTGPFRGITLERAIVDAGNQYEVTLRSRAGTQTADVTPQRTSAFKVAPGATVTWQNINVTDIVKFCSPDL